MSALSRHVFCLLGSFGLSVAEQINERHVRKPPQLRSACRYLAFLSNVQKIFKSLLVIFLFFFCKLFIIIIHDLFLLYYIIS